MERTKYTSRFNLKSLRIPALICIVLVILTELVARFAFGFGTTTIFLRDSECGYRPAPNQDMRRLGNHIYYNAQGLRSESIQEHPGPGITRILCVGDSITNGGQPTDQAQTWPYLLEKDLNSSNKVHTEVLNASCGGWALANEYGFVHKFGLFNSSVVIHEIGENDLMQPFVNSSIVGQHPSYPPEQPPFALHEVVFHYVLPRLLHQSFVDPGVEEKPSLATTQANLKIVQKMRDFVLAQHSKYYVMFVDPSDQYKSHDPRTVEARQLFMADLQKEHIPVLSPAEAIRQSGGQKLFRDIVHPNAQGNAVIAHCLAEWIVQQHFLDGSIQ